MSFRKGRARRFLATLLSLILVFVNESALSNVSWADTNDYDEFWSTEDYPTIVEVETFFYDRGEGGFPVEIESATADNIIYGENKIKARVSGNSVTLSWSSENAPSQICIEGDPDWDIRDISDGQTSVEIEFESGRDFYYIQAKYENEYDNFWGTEENPIVVEVEACYYDRDESEPFPVSIGSASEDNVIDGWDRMKARVSGNSVTLSWSSENAPSQICIEGDSDWDIRDISEGQTSVTIDFEAERDFYYIQAKYENDFDNFGPEGEYTTVVSFWTDFDRRDGDPFPISVASVAEENTMDGWDMYKVRVAGDSITLTWPEETRPTQICIKRGDDWDIRDVAEEATSETIDITGSNDWYIEVKYDNQGQGGGGGGDESFSEDATISSDATYMDVTVNSGTLTIDNCKLRIDHQLDVKSGANVVGTSDASILEIAGNGAITLGLDLYDTSGNLLSSGDDNHFQNNGEGPEEFTWNAAENRWEKSQNQPGSGGDYHNIGVDFLNDVSALPGDDTSKLRLMIVGRQSDNGIVYLDSNTDQWEFGKGSDGQHVFDLSVPDNAVCLGFQLSTAGKVVKSASYTIGEDTHELTETEIADLTSDGYFNIPVTDGANWVELIVFSVVVEEGNQPGGGDGDDRDVTYSEDTTITENTAKNDITVAAEKTLTIGDDVVVQVDHQILVESGAKVVGTSDKSILRFAHDGHSYGLNLYRTNNDLLSSGGQQNSFVNGNDGPVDFIWNTTTNRWETESNPSGGTDMPWYTVSYGNSANLSTEYGQVYAERVHVGDITYTLIPEEYNASDTDEVYSMEDTIFHKKTPEQSWDPMEIYGIGGSDGDIMISNDVSGVSVDFKFIPDYGYQLKDVYKNERDSLLNSFEPAETVSSFTLKLVQGNNVHFNVKFVEANNTVTGNAGISSGASISSANASSSGALEMTVNTGVPNNNIPQGSEALAAYDISLKNVVSKGEGRGNWETELTDLGSNSATVTLPVADTANYTYSVIREHEGEDAVTLDATIVDGGISFETNKFSTYTIVKKPKEKPLTSVKLEDEAGKIVTGTITLPVGSNRIYTIVRGQESQNKIGIEYSDDAANFEALLEEDQDSLKVVIGEVAGASVKGGFKIVNEDVLVDGNPTVLASFNVKGTNPAWVGKKVSASVVSATDVRVNINVKPFAALGDELYNGNYFYRVELLGEKEQINSELTFDPYTFFVPASMIEEGVKVEPFIDAYGDVIDEPGQGVARKFNVAISLIQIKSGEERPRSDEDVFLSSQVLKIATATKTPHYAEKISVKGGKTSFLSGEGNIKVGTVTFGKNDTFITNEDWIIRSVTDPMGRVYGTTSDPYEKSEDAYDNCGTFCGLEIDKAPYLEDNGLYVYSNKDAMPGKYTVVVATEGQNGQTPEAKFTFTVKRSITDLILTVPDKIYKPDNKNATAKSSVSASSTVVDQYGISSDVAGIKNPKVRYEVGIWNNATNSIDKVDGISISSKGIITIDKNFKVTDDNKDAVYTVVAMANEYDGQDQIAADKCKFVIVNEATKIKTLELYTYISDETTGEKIYTLVKPNALVMKDSMLAYAVKDAKGDYVVGGDGKDGHSEPQELEVGEAYDDNGIKIERSLTNDVYTPTKLTYTAKSIDGSTAKATINLTYSSDNDNYNGLIVAHYLSVPEVEDCKCINATGALEYTLPAGYGSNPILLLAIADENAVLEHEEDPDFEPFNYTALNKNTTGINSMISGSLSVSGAKVVLDQSKYEAIEKASLPQKQVILVEVNKPEVVVTLSKPKLNQATGKIVTEKTKYVIKTSAQLPNTAAPKIKSSQMAVPTDDGGYTYEKLPLGRKYSGDEVFEFKLSNKLTLPEGVKAENVKVRMNVTISEKISGVSIDTPYALGGMSYVEDGEDAYIKLACDGYLFNKYLTKSKLPISLEYYYLDGGNNPVYLTKAPTKATLTFTKYAKSFKINANQTLKFTLSDGVNLAKVESATIAGKGTNVKEVVIKRLYNCNVKGTYNDFTEIFENEEGWLGVKEGALTTLNNEAVAAKNKLPSARTGYVLCEVTYNDGTKEEVMSKVTVKFAK